MSIGIGVIGTGNMGTDHVRTLHRFVRNATVRAVADVDPARARAAVADVPGARVLADPHALIADAAVDAVVITSADSTHAEYATASVRAGKPVMCEKPLAPSLPEAIGVLQAIGSAGASLLSVGFMRRFDPGYVEMRAAVADGAIGTPLVVHCISRGVSAAEGTPSEYVITGSAVHEFDIVPWLLGSPIVEVAWHAPRSSSLAVGLQDPQLILLRTADGVLTTVEVFLNSRYGFDMRCELVGETGAVSLREPSRVHLDSDLRRALGYAADWRPRFADAYRLELQAWVDSLVAGDPTPLATAADGVTASAVADAVLQGMADPGRWVRVEAVPVLGE